MAIVKNGVKSYEGLVLDIYTCEERVMSDIYANVTHATVVERDGSRTSVYVKAHFECDNTDISGTQVDATPEVIALSKAKAELCSAEYVVAGTLTAIKAVKAKSKKSVPALASFLPILVNDLVLVKGKIDGIAKGEIVKVVWAGKSQFNDTDRLAAVVNGKKVYFGASKVELVCDEARMSNAEADLANARAEIAYKCEKSLEALDAQLDSAKFKVVYAKTAYEAALVAAAAFFPAVAKAA